MLNYAIKRLGLAVAIVSLAMFLLFCMIYLVPGDPASVALGPRATDAMKEALRIKMGLDQSIWIQFWNFFTGAWTGDLGEEVLSGRPVLTVVFEQLPFTLVLIAGASAGPLLWGFHWAAGPPSTGAVLQTVWSASSPSLSSPYRPLSSRSTRF